MTHVADRTITWTAFGKPEFIGKGDASIQFEYGPNKNRIRRIDKTGIGTGSETTTTTYVDGYERVEHASGEVIDRYYIGGIAIVTKSNLHGQTT